MFQFPSNQTLLLVLQGEEGCGKSVILDFMTHILGKHVSIEIQDVKENLFGRFNGHLAGKVLLNINETDRREMAPFIEKLKTIITSPTITIEEKGQKKYVEDNHAHLCMTINPENVLPIKEGSRRFFYSRASSLYIGNTEYFNELFRVSKNQIIWGGNYFGQLWQRSQYNKGFVIWDKKQPETLNNFSMAEMAWSSLDKPSKIFEYSVRKNRNKIHPTQKPVPLFEYLIKTYTKEGDLVLDNCAGSGTTAIACLNTNRRFIVIEKEQQDYEAIKNRVASHTQKLKL
jgi:hypothetical protein